MIHTMIALTDMIKTRSSGIYNALAQGKRISSLAMPMKTAASSGVDSFCFSSSLRLYNK